jgi:hypothetical protein
VARSGPSHDLQQRQSSDDFNERLNTAAKARKATLEKFRVTASWHRRHEKRLHAVVCRASSPRRPGIAVACSWSLVTASAVRGGSPWCRCPGRGHPPARGEFRHGRQRGSPTALREAPRGPSPRHKPQGRKTGPPVPARLAGHSAPSVATSHEGNPECSVRRSISNHSGTDGAPGGGNHRCDRVGLTSPGLRPDFIVRTTAYDVELGARPDIVSPQHDV